MMLSIIIPVYNSKNTIQRCLDSIFYSIKLVKKKFDFEIIISNDASDYSYTYLSETYDHLVFIDNDHNEGAGVARQKALDVANGEWICFIDSDDVLIGDWFSCLFNNDTKDVIIYNAYDSNGVLLAYDCVVYGKIIRKSFIDENNIRFHPILRIAEDSYFTHLLLYKCQDERISIAHPMDKSICYILVDNPDSTTNTIRITDKIALFALNSIYVCDALLNIDKEYFMKYTIKTLSGLFVWHEDVSPYNHSTLKMAIAAMVDLIDKYDINVDALIERNKLFAKFELMMDMYRKYKRNILFTLIIPLYESAEYLDKCLNRLYSSLGKMENYVEIVCVDDYSKNANEYQYIINKYSNHFNLRFYSFKKNVRMGMNRNRGIELARGKWIAFMDHDDAIGNKFFLEAFKRIKDNPKLNVVRNVVLSNCKDTHGNDAWFPCRTIILIHGSIYKKSFLDKYNLRFSDKLLTSEDIYFQIKNTIYSYMDVGTIGTVYTNDIINEDAHYYYVSHPKNHMNRLYNGRPYIEEFAYENFKSFMLMYNEVKDEYKKFVLLFAIYGMNNTLEISKYGTLNHKKSNIYLLSYLLYRYHKDCNVDLNDIVDDIENQKEYFDSWYTKLTGEINQEVMNFSVKRFNKLALAILNKVGEKDIIKHGEDIIRGERSDEI